MHVCRGLNKSERDILEYPDLFRFYPPKIIDVEQEAGLWAATVPGSFDPKERL